MAKLKELLTIEEVAKQLNFSPEAIWYLIQMQALVADNYFGETRVHVDEVAYFVEDYDFIPDHSNPDCPKVFLFR